MSSDDADCAKSSRAHTSTLSVPVSMVRRSTTSSTSGCSASLRPMARTSRGSAWRPMSSAMLVRVRP